MAVSKTARAGIREICDASEVPWTDQKIDERIRALRADARDAESNVSPEDLAEIMTLSFGTVLASVYGQANAEAVARKVYEVGLPTHTKTHLSGGTDVDWNRVSKAILSLIDDVDASEYDTGDAVSYDKYFFVDPNHPNLYGLPVPDEKVREAYDNGLGLDDMGFVAIERVGGQRIMAARYPSGPPPKPATDPTPGSVGSTGKGGHPEPGKKGGPRVDAGQKSGSPLDAGKKDGLQDEEATLQDVLAAVTNLSRKVDTQGLEMDELRQVLGNGLPRGAAQKGAEPLPRHGVSMFGNAQDVAAGNVRGLAGAAPRLGAMKPRSAPKEFEAEPDSVKDILRELLVERRARKEPEDYADSTAYTAGVKGVEKLENLRRKFREDPGEKHRVMMEKVHAVAPDLATYLEKCTNLSQCRLSTYLGVLLVEIMSAADREDLGRVRGLTAGGVQMLEQWTINGALELAWMYTLVPDSPLITANPDAPKVLKVDDLKKPKGRRAFATLAEHSVIAGALAAQKNYEELNKLLKDA